MARLMRWLAVCLLATIPTILLATDTPGAFVDWPAKIPVLHFEIGRFVKAGSQGNRNIYNIDVLVKNVSSTGISNATFHLYLLDKKNTRLADHFITLNNVKPGDQVKTLVTAQTDGTPVSFTVAPDHLPGELAYLALPTHVATKIDSVPSGANLSVDGKAAGTTPVVVPLSVGFHSLAFEKDGFNPGTSSITIAADETKGRAITIDLGGSVRDTLELRDGSIVTGDLKSINDDEVVMQTGDGLRKFSRDTVKRISLVQREAQANAAN